MKASVPRQEEGAGAVFLHREDGAIDHDLVKRALQTAQLDFDIERVETLEEFAQKARGSGIDLILADYRLPGFTAIEAWETLAAQGPRPPFVLVSGAIGEAAAVAAIQLGMSDYVLKDDLAKLAHVVQRSIERRTAPAWRGKRQSASWRRRSRGWPALPDLQATIEQERTRHRARDSR